MDEAPRQGVPLPDSTLPRPYPSELCGVGGGRRTASVNWLTAPYIHCPQDPLEGKFSTPLSKGLTLREVRVFSPPAGSLSCWALASPRSPCVSGAAGFVPSPWPGQAPSPSTCLAFYLEEGTLVFWPRYCRSQGVGWGEQVSEGSPVAGLACSGLAVSKAGHL